MSEVNWSWVFVIGFVYLWGIPGMYAVLFKDMESRWKYVLSALWIFIVPGIGFLYFLVESDQ